MNPKTSAFTPEQYEAFIKHTVLESVFAAKIDTSRSPKSVEIDEFELETSVSKPEHILTEIHEEHTSFCVAQTMLIKFSSAVDTGRNMRICIDLIARYNSLKKAKATDSIIEQFVKDNGIIHLWPYMRSTLFDIMQKMNLPPLPLPLALIPARNSLPAKSSTKKKPKSK